MSFRKAKFLATEINRVGNFPAGVLVDANYPLALSIEQAYGLFERAGNLLAAIGGKNRPARTGSSGHAWVNTLAGRGLKFAGATGYYLTDAGGATATAAAWSRELLFIPNSSAASALITYADGAGGSATRDRSLELIFTSSLFLQGYIFDGGSKTIVGSTALTTGKAYHVVLTVGGGFMNLYLNGRLDASAVAVSNTGYAAYADPRLVLGYGGQALQTLTSDSTLLYAIEYKKALAAAEVWLRYKHQAAIFSAGAKRRVTGQTTGIQFDAASNSGYQAAASTYSWSHTNAGNFLSVDVELLSVPGTFVSGITFDGVAMTLIGAKSTVSGAGRAECWGLTAPAQGSKTIAVTLSASVASASTAVSYSGVHQSSPTEGFNSAQATNVGAADATVAVTSVADNCWIHAACVSDDTSITAGQTTRNNVTGAVGSGADEDTGPITPAGATNMTYTGIGALATWAIAGYALRPLAASSLVFSGLRRRFGAFFSSYMR